MPDAGCTLELRHIRSYHIMKIADITIVYIERNLTVSLKFWSILALYVHVLLSNKDPDPTTFSIQYGVTNISSHGVNTIVAEKVIAHAGFATGNGLINDVAVIKLSAPLPLSSTVQPVQLPPAYNATPGGADAVLAGWGLSATEGSVMQNLQRVDIKVYTDEDCESIHQFTGPTSRVYHVCAGVPEGGKGQCSGDSGGPLVVNGVQVGVVSWSVKPCTVQGYPGVFAKLSSYVDWITKQIQEDAAAYE